MNERTWTPDSLLQMSNSYWQLCALHAALRLRVFDALGDDKLSSEQLASQLKTSPRGTEALVNALAALGLLGKTDGRFANTAESRSLLCRDSSQFMGHILLHHHYIMEGWLHLHESVRSGCPARTGSAETENDAEREAFLMGMFNIASRLAPQIAGLVDLSGRKRLLDLGGGPGTYAAHFCLKNPGLTAVVFDLPATEPFMKDTAERLGVADRVTFCAGDFNSGALPGGFDAVWISQILHQEGPASCSALLKKAASALIPGGLLFVQDFLLDDAMDRPVHPALFSLNMLVGTEEGQAYSEGQVRAMMAGAGAHDIVRLPLETPAGNGILAGQV